MSPLTPTTVAVAVHRRKSSTTQGRTRWRTALINVTLGRVVVDLTLCTKVCVLVRVCLRLTLPLHTPLPLGSSHRCVGKSCGCSLLTGRSGMVWYNRTSPAGGGMPAAPTGYKAWDEHDCGGNGSKESILMDSNVANTVADCESRCSSWRGCCGFNFKYEGSNPGRCVAKTCECEKLTGRSGMVWYARDVVSNSAAPRQLSALALGISAVSIARLLAHA